MMFRCGCGCGCRSGCGCGCRSGCRSGCGCGCGCGFARSSEGPRVGVDDWVWVRMSEIPCGVDRRVVVLRRALWLLDSWVPQPTSPVDHHCSPHTPATAVRAPVNTRTRTRGPAPPTAANTTTDAATHQTPPARNPRRIGSVTVRRRRSGPRYPTPDLSRSTRYAPGCASSAPTSAGRRVGDPPAASPRAVPSAASPAARVD
jgi:hypothetical protein